MLKINENSKDKIKQIYFKNSNSSIFGIEKLENFRCHEITLSDVEAKLLRTIMLKEHELLIREPATLGCVQMLKPRFLEMKKFTCDDKKITNKKYLLNGFNNVLKSCNINEKTYQIFKQYLKSAGPGTKIEIETDSKILDYEIQKISKTSFPLVTIFNNIKSSDIAHVLIFRGFINDANQLNPIFSWLKEKNEPIIILASNYSNDFLKQIEIKIKYNNLKICLMNPDPNNELSEFCYYDLSHLSNAHQIDELPDFFIPEYCGIIKNPEFSWNSLKFNCDEENKILLENKIKKDFNDSNLFSILPIIEKRISSISNNTIKITIPEIFVAKESATIDELSGVISIWSKFIFEDHIELPEYYLQSFPCNTIEKSIEFLNSVKKIIDEVEIFI